MRRRARYLRLKRLAVAVLCAPWAGRLIGRLYRGRIPYRGAVIDVRGLALPPAIKALLFWGLYESAEYRFVRDHLRPDLDVIELGSGLGAISVQVARRLDAGRKLVCVEANPGLFTALETNLAANPAGCEVVAVPAAVSSAGGERATFEVNAWHLGSKLAEGAEGAEGAERADAGDPDAELIEARTRSLEQLWRRHLDGGAYQLVLDVEGAEAGIVEHEAAALGACRGLVIECHPGVFGGRSCGVEELIEKIQSRHGFELADRYGPVCFFRRPG